MALPQLLAVFYVALHKIQLITVWNQNQQTMVFFEGGKCLFQFYTKHWISNI